MIFLNSAVLQSPRRIQNLDLIPTKLGTLLFSSGSPSRKETMLGLSSQIRVSAQRSDNVIDALYIGAKVA